MKLNQYQWNPDTDKRGEGSFAEVFEAKDNNGDSVALKIYRESVVQSTSEGSFTGKYSLENEFSKGKHLSHTNVIRYIGLDYLVHINILQKQASYPVLIMEYADAGSLETRLNSTNGTDISDGRTVTTLAVLTEAEKLKIAREILEGLTYLHRQGIVHRDLKPANILFKTDRTSQKVVKITDFGISRDSLAKHTGATTFGVGTVSYMAPEQFLPKTYGLNGELSNRTDLWAFGVIFYRMFAGRLPFNGQEGVTDTQPDFSVLPARYRAMVQCCLQKNAAKRYASAKEIIQVLENSPVVPPKPKSQSPRFKIAGIIVAVLLLCSAVFRGYQSWQTTQPVFVTNAEMQMSDSTKDGIVIQYYTYTGWTKSGIPDGQGTKVFKNGNKYTGNSKDGRADGNGTMLYKMDNGFDKYEGPFDHGRPNGTGTYTFANNDKYVGDFKNGIKEGHGTFYVNRDDQFKGDKYVGDYANDDFNGEGTYYWRSGQIYTGQFQNGQMQGKGKLTYVDGGVYQGDFINGQRQGQGSMKYADSSSYTGSWNGGKRDGYGIMHYKDGKKYDGYFKNDLRDGEGTLTFPDGSKYVGAWAYDAANGYGKIYDGSGNIIQSGNYVDGKVQE